MGWTTLADVQEITGKTDVTAEQLAAAESVITIYANRTPDTKDRLTKRDQYWLAQASAWQAVWQREQAGHEVRNGHASQTQDGVSVQHDTEHEIVLAPLAARAMKNLSWKADRVKRAAPFLSAPAAVLFPLESSDEGLDWRPL